MFKREGAPVAEGEVTSDPGSVAVARQSRPPGTRRQGAAIVMLTTGSS